MKNFKKRFKKFWKKFWFIVWKDDSLKGWIISIIFLFVVIKFIFFPLLNLATGTTLSAGFFLLPGIAAMSAGPAITLAYLIAALPLIPATFSIVELTTAMPRAGGLYYFLDRSMGPLLGTIGGIGTWLALIGTMHGANSWSNHQNTCFCDKLLKFIWLGVS